METRITNLLHNRLATIVTMALAVVAAIVGWGRGDFLPVVDNLGLGLPSPGTWLGVSFLSLIISLAANVAMGMMIIWINRTYNTLRSLTHLGATLFFVMECAMPQVMAQFYGGTLLALLMMWCASLLFSTYGSQTGQRRIYLIFFLLTLAGFFQVNFFLYVPVLLVGCAQMRVLKPRGITAALLGIITSPWILFGFGIVRPDMLSWPDMVLIWKLFDTGEMVKAIVITGFTLVCGIGFMSANLLKILSYNARTRAYNGFLNLLWIATALFTVLNFNDFSFYIPLLNLLTAYQAAHFFTYRRQRRSYVPVLVIICIYIVFCIWSFV